jgi:hypothetical protein
MRGSITVVLLALIGCSPENALHPQNQVPTVAITSHADGARVPSDALFELGGELGDPDDVARELHSVWKVDGAKFCETHRSPRSGIVRCSQSLPPGTHTVRLEVTDPDGERQNHEITLIAEAPRPTQAEPEVLTVLEPATHTPLPGHNHLPVVDGVRIAPTPAYRDSELACTYAFTDDDGDVDASTVRWLRGASQLGTDRTLAGMFRRGDEVTCEVTPFDGQDSAAPVRTSVVIANAPPSADAVTLEPAAPSGNTPVSALPTGWVDLDDDAEGYEVQWTVGGVVLPSATGLTLDSAHFASGDTLSVRLVPTDGIHQGAPLTASALVLNTAPEISGATLTPAVPTTDTTLTATAVGWFDVDGDAPSYHFAWTVNGLPVGGDSRTLDGSWFRRDDEVEVQITPDDGSALGAPRTATAVIGNTAPLATALTINPGEATTSTPLSALLTGLADADSDPIEVHYTWTVNTTPVGGDSTALGSEHFERGDVVVVRTTLTDRTDAGAPLASSPLTIANSLPSLVEVVLGPDPITFAEPIEATPAGWSDADGDLEDYRAEWTVNGAPAGGASLTLSAGHFEAGDAVQVTLYPWDGLDEGSPVESLTAIVSDRVVCDGVPSLPVSSCEHLEALYLHPDDDHCLTADIDCAGHVPFATNSGSFRGSLRGDGHRIDSLVGPPLLTLLDGALIKGMTVVAEADRAAFAYDAISTTFTDVHLSASATIAGFVEWVDDTAFEDCSADVDIHSPMSNGVGGFVGTMVSGDIIRSDVRGIIEGNTYVGGFVGFMEDGVLETVTADVDITGLVYVGGVVGNMMGGSVLRAHTVGRVEATGTYAGGIAGSQQDATIEQARGSADIFGGGDLGGISGIMNNGTIHDSYADGTVQGIVTQGGLMGSGRWSTITHSYAVAWVPTGGGLCQSFTDGSLTSSYWNVEVAGTDWSGAGEALTTAEMTNEANFVGWDFATTWDLSGDHPTLRWQEAL